MCIFCRIVNGELPSHKIYEDGDFIAILDIAPANVGHAIVIPKGHCENIHELPEGIAEKLFPIAVRLSNAIRDAVSPDGLNILQNNGEYAGQSVNHFHLHLIPRRKGDGFTLETRHIKPTPEEFEKTRNDIIRYVD